MRDAVLAHFPARTHPLTLVSDPDGVLADEALVATLAERGFTLLAEPDQVMLRLRVEACRPWSEERPLVIVTDGRLEDLPYDLWHDAHRVTLALGTFFQSLAIPIVRELTPDQRARLAAAPAPVSLLGRERTCDYVLRHVFDIDVAELGRAPRLVAWLNRLFARQEALPRSLVTYLNDLYSHQPNYARWPFERLLQKADVFAEFMREQWRGYVQQATGTLIAEAAVDYVVDFANSGLQDGLAGLVRTGAVRPLGVEEPDVLPAWAKPGVVSTAAESMERGRAALIEDLTERVAGLSDATPWGVWQPLLRAWAELRTISDDPSGDPELAAPIESAFDAWLVDRYSALGGQRLPVPHHVHHVPHSIALERRTGGSDRVALLVLDGMSLSDWHTIERVWRARHADWRVETRLVLAQVPTITSISRQALVSGLRPTEFRDTLDTTSRESNRWSAFWARENLLPAHCSYRSLAFDQTPDPALPAHDVRALCLVDVSLDEMIHGATNGNVEFASSLEVWLAGYSPNLERFLATLLADGFALYIASDHGHVEARGIGANNEGLAVELKAKRARIYRERLIAENAVSVYDGARLWAGDGILPDDLWAALPPANTAFTKAGDLVVTHGGASLDEVVTPFAKIELGYL